VLGVRYIDNMNNKTDTTYNGWSNYATWRVNLEIVDGIMWSEEETTFKDIYSLSQYIKDTAESLIDNETNEDMTILSNGYAHAFISEVNYYEIAKSVAESYPALITGTETQNGEPLTDNL